MRPFYPAGRRRRAFARVGNVTTGANRCFAAPDGGETVERRHAHDPEIPMKAHAAITVYRPREEVERLWRSSEHRPSYADGADAAVRFLDAPGDRGTEIHVALDGTGGALQKLTGAARLAKLKDELRRFKQLVETGEIPRSDSTPEGERAERKLKQRPAQPLDDAELQKVGAR